MKKKQNGFAVWFGPEFAEAISRMSVDRRDFVLKTISAKLRIKAKLDRRAGRPCKVPA